MSDGWLYNFFIYLFGFNLLFALTYFFSPQTRLRQVTISFTIVAWGMESLLFILWLIQLFSFQGFESFFLYSWAMLTGSLICLYFVKLDVLLVFANFFCFLVWLQHLIFPRSDFLITELMMSKWVFIHVVMAMVAYAAFSLSSCSAGMYLFTNYLLKKKKWHSILRLLPSLGQVQLISKRLMQIGLTLLLCSLIQGFWIAYQRMDHSIFFDPKTIGSIIILIVYTCILLYWKMKGCQNRKLAWWNFLSILLLMVNYYFLNTSFSFHNWV
ncbi:HemX family protein [Seinonella peptonophila]|uniref:HemX family protein n=1 Tax=Seinonella peptonophila TaxID=112248 RepID=A0A1M4TUM4_9BACL|nr:cytochrome c biogenesis protein CcsA [Seinonella peptonophila]SHE48180.1 HemX family protein [Seinonella peptonophila]